MREHAHPYIYFLFCSQQKCTNTSNLNVSDVTIGKVISVVNYSVKYVADLDREKSIIHV